MVLSGVYFYINAQSTFSQWRPAIEWDPEQDSGRGGDNITFYDQSGYGWPVHFYSYEIGHGGTRNINQRFILNGFAIDLLVYLLFLAFVSFSIEVFIRRRARRGVPDGK